MSGRDRTVRLIDTEHTARTDRIRWGGLDSARVALVVFALVEAVAGVLWFVTARRQWFQADEWDFLAGRTAGDLGDLFRDHYGHWSTLPILVYRCLWWVVGLRSYLPYLALVVLLHLTIAALIRCVMRRAGVGPWVATSAASAFALFGSGLEDVTWAFQIGYEGSLVLGITHLLLADHDGGFDRRDVLGIATGLAGLMCSSIGIVMTAVVGLAVLMRRGWKAAALHTAPLVLAYVVWWFAIGRQGSQGEFALRFLFRWVGAGVSGVFDAIAQLRGVGVLLAVVFVVGAVLAWLPLSFAGFLRQAAMPVALAIGAIGFLVVSGIARNDGFISSDFARSSRYEHVLAAMLLPAIAVGVDYFARRQRVLVVAGVALLLVGIPGNIRTLVDTMRERAPSQQDARRLVLALAYTPRAKRVPRAVEPVQERPDRFVTVGWLLDGARSGRIPNPGRLSRRELSVNTFRLSIAQTNGAHPPQQCQLLLEPVTAALRKGETIRFRDHALRVTALPANTGAGTSLTYRPENGDRLVVVIGRLDVRLTSEFVFPFPSALCNR
jgi:hypothetical protein